VAVQVGRRDLDVLVVHLAQDAFVILAFAERVLPRAADLRVQASLEQRQRFQQLFCPDGIAFDGKRFVRTAVTAPTFSYLRGIQTGNEGLVDQNSASWNPIAGWLRQLEFVRSAA